MHRWVRLKLEVGRRAQAFCRENPSSNPGILRWVDQLEQSVRRAGELQLQAIDAANAGLAATSRRAELRQQIRSNYLRPLLGILNAAAVSEPGGVTRWSLPLFRTEDVTFAATVRGAGDEARRVRDLMTRHGMPPGLVHEMLSRLDEWDACGRWQAESRARRVGARAGLEAATDEILSSLQVLDALFRTEYLHNPALSAAWHSARHIPWPVGKAAG
jgi:hypothetical protein